MTPLPAPSLPDRLRAHAHLHPESAELLREAADRIDGDGAAVERDREVARIVAATLAGYLDGDPNAPISYVYADGFDEVAATYRDHP